MSATGVVTLTTLYPSWLWAFIALGVVLAFSRVYLRVHYVLDVLAGLLLGTVFGFVVVLLVPPP
jgi:membrane-associated phospholipid phosphatase